MKDRDIWLLRLLIPLFISWTCIIVGITFISCSDYVLGIILIAISTIFYHIAIYINKLWIKWDKKNN